MYKTKNEKEKVDGEEDDGKRKPNEHVDKEIKLTEVNTQYLLEADYTRIQTLRDNLVDLTQQRIKGKYRPAYHVQVLTKMVEEMPPP